MAGSNNQKIDMRQLARLGAEATIKKLREQILVLERAFPGLGKSAVRDLHGRFRRANAPMAKAHSAPRVAKHTAPTSLRQLDRAVTSRARVGQAQSAATRRAIAAGLRRRWAKRRKQAAAAME